MTSKAENVITLTEKVLQRQSIEMFNTPAGLKKITLSFDLFKDFISVFESVCGESYTGGEKFYYKGILLEPIESEEIFISISLI